MATVKIPPVLRTCDRRRKRSQCIRQQRRRRAAQRHRELSRHVERQIFGPDGDLNRYVNVYLNNEDVRVLEGLDTSVEDADTVMILPAMAGGAS